ncbi:alpha/beta hydrolase-fold protein, partial [Acinetobacter baumannii]
VTPDSYQHTKNHFPVVYLLHGYSGDYANWIKLAPKIKQYTNDYQLIIVCPDGGYSSWYVDSPIDSSYKYETFVANELIRYVDA